MRRARASRRRPSAGGVPCAHRTGPSEGETDAGCRCSGGRAQAGGRRVHRRLPDELDHRGGSAPRHSPDHRAPGAHRRAHGGRVQPVELRASRGRLRDAERAGTENSFGGVAQAFSESVPLVVLPLGYSRALTNVPPNFSALLNYQHVTKSCEQVTVPAAVGDALRRAFTQARNGRPGPRSSRFPAICCRRRSPSRSRTSRRRSCGRDRIRTPSARRRARSWRPRGR